ncbi:MAG: serine hydrolase [Gemmatimonadales bacterium]|jgi:CubicO group peptidase (beta-lactamase class C family)
MARLWALFIVGLVACQAQQDRQEVDAHIAAIENELLPSLVIRGEPVETATLAERIEALGVPGVSIAVINDGEIEWARGYGLADVESGRPVTTTTLFQAASISKPVAATAALRFVQDGLLELDEDVNGKLVSWKVPDNEFTEAQPVTLRGLVTHTAGMTVHGFPGYARDQEVPSTIGVLDGEGNTDPIRVDMEPRTEWRYSGGGYTVMQQLLADIAGKSFPEIMRETVLEPFGMSESTYEQPLPEARWEQAATAYESDGEGVEGKWHIYPEMAAAGLWTTPSDLARFAIAIQEAYAGESEAVLSTEMVRQMLTPDLNDHGLGPAIQGGGARFGHGGSNAGFRCTFTAFIEDGSGAAIMTNSDTGGALAQEILLNVGLEYGWPGFEQDERTVAELEPATYEELAGRYEIEGFGAVTVEYVDGRLWAEADFVPRVELLPESETVFFARDDGQRVTFVKQDGRVVAFVVQGTRAEKVE